MSNIREQFQIGYVEAKNAVRQAQYKFSQSKKHVDARDALNAALRYLGDLAVLADTVASSSTSFAATQVERLNELHSNCMFAVAECCEIMQTS